LEKKVLILSVGLIIAIGIAVYGLVQPVRGWVDNDAAPWVSNTVSGLKEGVITTVGNSPIWQTHEWWMKPAIGGFLAIGGFVLVQAVWSKIKFWRYKRKQPKDSLKDMQHEPAEPEHLSTKKGPTEKVEKPVSPSEESLPKTEEVEVKA